MNFEATQDSKVKFPYLDLRNWLKLICSLITLNTITNTNDKLYLIIEILSPQFKVMEN